MGIILCSSYRVFFSKPNHVENQINKSIQSQVMEIENQLEEYYTNYTNYNYNVTSDWYYDNHEWYCGVDLNIINTGTLNINVKLLKIKIYNTTYFNMTTSTKTNDVYYINQEYIEIPANNTYKIHYEYNEDLGSVFHMRIEFTLHFYEPNKIETLSYRSIRNKFIYS